MHSMKQRHEAEVPRRQPHQTATRPAQPCSSFSVSSPLGRPSVRCAHRHMAVSSLILLGCAHLALLRVSALSQAQKVRLTPSDSPNWSKVSAMIPFILMLLITPIQIATFILIIRRRRRYPIAGRGWLYLLVTCGVSMIVVFLTGLVALYFPIGIPCPVNYLLALVAIFPMIAYCSRAWILICRLEVRNFLAERQWRLDKKAAIEEMKEEKAKEGKEDSKNVVLAAVVEEGGESRPTPGAARNTMAAATNGNNEVERIRIRGSSSEYNVDDEEEVDLSPESMQGYFFIQNRWLTHPRFLLGVAGFVLLYVVTSLIAMIFLDPDVAQHREWRAANGLPPDPEDYGSQFLDGHFFNSPLCISNSIKINTTMAVSYAVIPIGIWSIWRLWLNSHRQKVRSKERREFHRRRQGGDANTPYVIPAAFASDDLDDSQLVKNEFSWCIVIVVFSAITPTLSVLWGKQWSCLIIIAEHAAYWAVSLILPLLRSEAISRRHRQTILQSRGGEAAAPGTKGRKSRVYAGGAALPHQRPYFSLKFILHNAHTYPVLLKFLRKEYSSENALFYTEVRELKKLCTQLERAMPSWPQGRDEDLLGSQVASVGASTGGGPGAAAGGASLVHQRPAGGGGGGLESRVSFPASGRVRPSGPQQLTADRPALSPVHDSQLARGGAAAGHHDRRSRGSGGKGGSGVNGFALQLQQLQLQQGSGDHRMTFTLPLPPSPSNANATASPSNAASTPTAMMTTAETVMSVTPATSTTPVVDRAAVAARFSSLHADAHRAKEWCLRIHAEFLAKSAIFEINIPDDLSALVSSQIAQLRRHEPTPLDANGVPRIELTTTEEPQPPPFALSLLFAATQLGILNLMETDSFRRFILTAEFRALLAAADDAEVARRETQADLQADLQGDLAAVAALDESGGDAPSVAHLASPSSAGAAGAVLPLVSGIGAVYSLQVAPAGAAASRLTPTSSQKKAAAAAAAAQVETLPGSVM